jgi:hypothetical protein
MLNTIRRKVSYTGRHFTPTWRYVFNLKSTLAYRKAEHRLPEVSQCLLANLRRDGMALTTVNEWFGEAPLFTELRAAVEQLEAEAHDRIAIEREKAKTYDPKRKTFILPLLGDTPVLNPDSIYARFALQPAVLELANEYFGMYTQLRWYNVWHTLRSDAPPRESQLWHRDRDDHFILKMFVYLSDIDVSSGALTYAPGTHTGGTIHTDPEYSLEGQNVHRTSDEQMARVVPAEKWVTASGKAGTILLADTSGYHKGGLARSRDRLQYLCMFTSPTSQVKELFLRPTHLASPADLAQRMALQGKGKFI